jgi:hypothetical protein
MDFCTCLQIDDYIGSLEPLFGRCTLHGHDMDMSLCPLEDVEGLFAHLMGGVPPTIEIVPLLLEDVRFLDDITPL